MIRSVIKSAAARVISWSGADRVAHGRLHCDVPFTVSYHRVVERLDQASPFALPSMEITTKTLERHLDWLARHFRIVSLDELHIAVRSTKPLACITVDDGYSDVYRYAFPILQKKGLPAGIFVVTDLVGTDALPMHEELHAALVAAGKPDPFVTTRSMLQRLPRADVLRIIEETERPIGAWRDALRPMSWDMLAEMSEAGMTIGSHTQTHAFLANETPATIARELEGSRRALQERLGVRAEWLSYPGGSFNPAVLTAAIRAGYRYAFTDCNHRNREYPLLTLPRRTMWERSCSDAAGRFSPAIMSCHAAAMFDRFSRCEVSH